MLHLGAFELDPVTAELSRAGRRVHLPSQSARLLLLLASRAPEVVSRDEIRRGLWPDGLHVEFDAAVNACISQIRSALNDSARAPRFIETIPRQGYRCLVEQAIASGRPAVGQSERQAIGRSGIGAVTLPLLAAVLVMATIGLLWSAGGRARAAGSSSMAAMQKYERGI